MTKFKNPFKKQEAPAQTEQKQPEIETAVVIVQYEKGGSSVGFLNVEGLKKNRPATMNDLYRMVCEVKQQIENLKICDRMVNVLTQVQAPRGGAPSQAVASMPVSDNIVKEIKPVEEKPPVNAS